MDAGLISIVLSGLALVVSAATAWFTLWRRGTIRMTRPTLIFFGPDGSHGPMKVFMRALLFSTAERGHIIEHLYVCLRRGKSTGLFSTWIVRDESLSRGSGLFVDRRGVACDHHFVLAKDGSTYEFLPGEHVVEIYASCVGRRSPIRLSSETVSLSEEQALSIHQTDAGVFFDWNPESGIYDAHLDRNHTAELSS